MESTKGNLRKRSDDFWQENTNTLKEKLLYMQKNRLHTDIVFLVGKLPNLLYIHAHKLLIVSNSPVFDALLQRWDQSNNTSINLPEDNPYLINLLIDSFYKDNEDPSSLEEAMDLIEIANKYICFGTIKNLVKYFKKSLCEENVIRILEISRKYNLLELLEDARQVLFKLCHKLFQDQQEFNKLNIEDVVELLRSDELIVDELKLFNVIYAWAQAKIESDPVNEKLEEILASVIQHIRFPCLTKDEFFKHVVPKGILSIEQLEMMESYYKLSNDPKNSDFSKFASSMEWKTESRRLPVLFEIVKPYMDPHFGVGPHLNNNDPQSFYISASKSINLRGLSFVVGNALCIDGTQHFYEVSIIATRYGQIVHSEQMYNLTVDITNKIHCKLYSELKILPEYSTSTKIVYCIKPHSDQKCTSQQTPANKIQVVEKIGTSRISPVQIMYEGVHLCKKSNYLCEIRYECIQNQNFC